MNKNYLAWDIKHDDFFRQSSGRDRLKFLVRFAILAPSSHNAQPWKFEVTDNSILIKPEFQRVVPVSDPENRHLYIALGCALENLLVAADYYGIKYTVDYLPQEKKGIAAKIYFTVNPSTLPEISRQHLIFSITTRRSNRNKYTHKIPSQEFIEKIDQLPSNVVQSSKISNQEEKEIITDIFMESRLGAFSDKAFRGEMADYKRTNFTTSALGMPGFTMGINDPLSLVAPFLIRHFNVMKVIRNSEEMLLKKYTPLFLFVNSKTHDILGWIRTGQILQKILLTAEQYGLQTAMSALPPDINAIQKILKTTYRPQMFVRLGYSSAIPGHAPRLEADKVIET